MDPVTLSALIGGGTSVLGGLIGSSQADKVARAQTRAAQLEYQAAQDAIAEQRRQYDTTRTDYQPYREAGTTSLSSLLSGNQSGQFTPTFSFNFNANTDPGAQLRQDRALKAIQASAAAKGGALSTGTLRSLMQESQDLASQEYQSAYGRASDQYNRDYQAASDTANRYQNIANMGLGATGSTAQLGAQMAGNVGNLLTSGASSLGQGMTGSAETKAAGANAIWNGVSGAVNQGLGAYLYGSGSGRNTALSGLANSAGANAANALYRTGVR